MTHGHVLGDANGENMSNPSAQHKPLSRAKEAEELLTSVQKQVVDFIRKADEDAPPDLQSNASTNTIPTSALLNRRSPQDLQSLLQLNLPTQPLDTPGLLNLTSTILSHSVNTWHQSFLDKLYSTNTPIGLASDLLLSALNTNAHVYAVSPALTLIEKHTSRALASLFGLTGPYAGGVTQPGGSAANSSSMVIARNVLYPETKVHGNGARKFVLFTSEHGHYSIEKAAQICGFGSHAVKSVAVDAEGKMIPAALETAIGAAQDRGETPFYVNVTAGTTVLGSFDPIAEIVQVARKCGLWVHVDGSWGGSVVFSEQQRAKVHGSELVDSISLCAHKMLNVPMTCSFLLARDLRQFQQGMTLPAGYLFHDPPAATSSERVDTAGASSQDHFYDLADLTPQCGRRGDALKLFLAWNAHGATGFAAHIDHAFAMAAHLCDLLARNAHFRLVSAHPPPCLQVCFYYHHHTSSPADSKGEDEEMRVKNSRTTETICQTLMQRGEFMVDYAPGAEGKFFRVVVNCYTQTETVERLVRRIQEVGRELGF